MLKCDFLEKLKEASSVVIDSFVSTEAPVEMVLDELRPLVKEAIAEILADFGVSILGVSVSLGDIVSFAKMFSVFGIFCKHHKKVRPRDLRSGVWRAMFLSVGVEMTKPDGILLKIAHQLENCEMVSEGELWK